MKGYGKLPYKVQFQPQYQTFQERMGKLPVPPVTSNTVIQPVDQLIDLIGLKEKIKDDELQFTPSTIYSQYASANILKQGKKNMSQLCPGCGQDNKKPIQCQFCGIMFCKNCCWRKRVIPNLSQPKQHRISCQDCHMKFVKLFVNQKFYDESAIFQKIIDTCSGRVKKLQKDVKGKKQRFEAGEKKKKQYKIKQNMLLKQVKDEQKKVQALQLKLQEVVNKKAQKLKQAQQRIQQQNKKQQQQADLKRRQQQNIRRQQQIEQNRRRKQQIQKERQEIIKKQQQTRRQIERQQRQLQQQRRKQRQRSQQLRKIQEKKNQELKALTLQNNKQNTSDARHKKQADELRDLAKHMMKQPQHLDEQMITNAPDIMVTSYEVQNTLKTPIQKKQSLQILFTPVNTLNSPTIRNHKSNTSSTAHQQKDSDIKNLVKSASNSGNDSEAVTNTEKKELKAQLTQSTQKATQNHLQLQNSLKTDEKIKQQKQNLYKTPDITIDVTAMTVNQLLGIHVDPYGNQNKRTSSTRRVSQRESYQQDKRASYNQTPQSTPNTIQRTKSGSGLQLTEQQKLQILRSSNVSASLLHSAHTEQDDAYGHSDPGGSKCNCNLM